MPRAVAVGRSARVALLMLLAVAMYCFSVARAVPLADVNLVSACSANLSDPDAPVLAALRTTFGADSVEAARMFLGDTPVGQTILSSDASTCLANLNGAKLSDALTEALKTPNCAALRTLTDMPFVRDLVSNMTAKNELVSFTKLLRNVSSDAFDTACSLYTTQIVPCLNSELLPAIATIRAKFATGCCDAWGVSAVRDFSYSVSDLLTKVAQLTGDVLCARQSPAFVGSDKTSQTCAFTFAQTVLRANDSATLGADVITALQVPTDQMCLAADGRAYSDVRGDSVGALDIAQQLAPSGCVLPLDRAASWIAALPITQRTTALLDTPALFAPGKCVQGSEFYPLVRDFFPPTVVDVVGAYFAKACVTIPIKYADKCAFERPVVLNDWASEPSKVKASNLGETDSESETKNPTGNITSFVPRAPVDGSSSSAGGDRSCLSMWLLPAIATVVVAVRTV